ncbi:nuclear pore complex protein Nup98-Nup96 [Fopius arisanus]|uniref:Nuclear pore complex protein Nup98-Nup96 n=1 Tax=Fopius arisanus TaxID=64838 RepID=A0A9R1U5P3_9HYME|nr:PREDICTED: nuclear pore complex protein Nup98-Nup96 [Fopius arisanus]XP_011308011.1 PREDICTED: nuclear pore complex protein Nup98-Nup96 [Fopius arisanus]XP_011308019.1 PREDICTED: nuclear pore complex protein Nup98-Nup96 [Fopius arisanus]
MFGNTGNTSFGFNTASQSSPFGQTGFGKPINTTTGFGTPAAPVFGANNTSSLFSAKPAGTTTGGLFGSPIATTAFNQPATTQSSFGGFGTSTANTSLFGTQPTTNTSIFGTGGTTSAFGQAQKPAGFGFGSGTGTSLFGQTQQPVQQTTPFGQMNNTANTSLFGNPGGFRAATTSSGITGTGMVKFNLVTGTDTMVKNGATQNISTRHHCIMCMKEYENKSLEELRLEDYTAGLKGPAQPGQTTSLFGAPTQTSPFGNTGAITSTGTTGFGTMSSGFGTPNQSTTSGGLFGKPVTGFGPATTTSAFAFNSTPSTGLFGTNTAAKPFGAPASTTLFSNTSTNQPATGFGTLNATQTNNFGGFITSPQNQSIGLFNQNKPAFNIAPATSNTGFGFGQTVPASTSNTLFGTKPLGTAGFAASTTGFGATPAPAFGTNPGFGTTPNTNTSLFNTPFKPATQTSGFSFGATPASTSALGTNTALTLGGTSSLFGQNKPAGGLFGNPAGTSTFNNLGTFGTTGGFGTTATNTGLGMNLLGGGMANPVQQNPSSVPVHQQILALVSAPFGDSPLLKNLLPASGKTAEVLKPANPAASKSLNGSQFKVSTTNSPKVKARVVTPAQLSKKSLFEGLEEEDPTLLEAFQPRSNAKRLVLRPKPLVNTSSSTPQDNLNTSQRNNDSSPLEAQDTSSCSVEVEPVDKENCQRRFTDRRSSSPSWLRKKKLSRNLKIREEEFDGQRSPFNSSDNHEEPLENTVSEFRTNDNIQATSKAAVSSPSTSLNCSLGAEKSVSESALFFSDSNRDLDESALSLYQSECCESNSAKVSLRRAGYYTIPPVDQLDEFVRDESCIVPNFTIGRKGYGNVYFPDSFDIYGLNFDEIVYFRHKEVVIYPDDDKKPPVGLGLNRRAQVTLDRVWPQDKNLHEPITDPHRLIAMNYEAKLRRVSEKHDMRFLEYRPETGSWVFKVDHFSKYGLSDSDDEDELPANANLKKLKPGETPQNFLVAHRTGVKKKSPGPLKQVQLVNGQGKNQGYGDVMEVGEHEEDPEDSRKSPVQQSEGITREKQSALSPTSIYARLAGTDSHKLQLMKASFFDTGNGDDPYNYTADGMLKPFDDEKKEQKDVFPPKITNFIHQDSSLYGKSIQNESFYIEKLNDTMGLIRSKTEAVEAKAEKTAATLIKYFPPPVVNPVTVVLKFRCEVIPLKETISSKLRFQCISDIGIQMGRKFKPCWGPGLTLISLSSQEQASVVPLQNKFSQIESYMSGRLLDDNTSTSIVQRLQILGGSRADADYIKIFKESIEGHLLIQLNNCVIGQESNCPWIRPGTGESGLNALHHHCNLAQELVDQSNDHLAVYANDVWQLCVALWGKLAHVDLDSNVESHENVMIRREAFGEWLKEVVETIVQNETSDTKDESEKILSLLTANKLEEACELARKSGDYSLALLISQLGGAASVQELIKQTIALWQATDTLSNISMERLKIYMLAAGTHLIMSNDETINVCEKLDWKRALAIHLWYLSPPTASITDVLELFESSFNPSESNEQIYAAPPLPEYKEEEFEAEVISGKKTYDLCYHLIKLYSTGNHSLEELLNPLTHTSDPLDYRLSWLLQQVILGLGYSHLSEHVATMTHTNLAAQLEAHDLWHWAIFVDLHLDNAGIRKKAVLDLLSRHVQIDEDPEYIERENFLKEQLEIPSIWINEAKAVKALAVKRFGEAAWYLLQAQQWNQAHRIIIQHLAADAVINENYAYLRSLLMPIVPPECHNLVNGWSHQGQLLWDYMEIAGEIEQVVKDKDLGNIGYRLELLQPQLSSLCTKINQFPCNTAKLTLCQAEIAKRTLHLARSLLLMQPSEDRSTTRVLVHLVSQLPLPEDYAQQELRPLINMCVNEIVGH